MPYKGGRYVSAASAYRTRRVYRRKAAKAWASKKKLRRANRAAGGRHGGTFIVRKAKEIVSSGSGVLGGYTITGAQNAIVLGTPVSQPGGNGLYDIPFAITARLDDVTNYSELTALYDRYKIVSMKVSVQGWNASNAPATPLPFVQYTQDYDSNVLPTISGFRERMGTKTKYFTANRPAITMGVRPKVAPEAYAAGGGVGFLIPRSQMWVNTLNTNVEHYGITGILRNVYLPAQLAASTLTWEVSYGIALRDVQ